MITGLPAYASPAIQSLRCRCGVRFVVLISDSDNEQAARMDAIRLNADFIDARRLLAFECYCGLVIEVGGDVSNVQ